MSHAFIDEDAFVPAAALRRTVHAEPQSITYALADIRTEGLEHIEEIARDYDLDPQFLLGRWMRATGPVPGY